MTAGYGYEVAKFKLNPGVGKEAFIKASENMLVNFYATQDGFVQRKLVELEEGCFLEFVEATTKEAAIDICSNWKNNKYCDEFLSFIDRNSVSIDFGSSA